MALFGSLSTVRAQAPRTPGFTAAFAYVEALLQPDSAARARLGSLAAGESYKIDLGGGVFAVEQVYHSKPRAEGFFESHRQYIDVQVMVEGDEVMEVVDASRITVRDPYLAERDLVTYLDTKDASQLRVAVGEAAIFFPADVHMPGLRPGSIAGLVRKSVVKVPVG